MRVSAGVCMIGFSGCLDEYVCVMVCVCVGMDS